MKWGKILKNTTLFIKTNKETSGSAEPQSRIPAEPLQEILLFQPLLFVYLFAVIDHGALVPPLPVTRRLINPWAARSAVHSAPATQSVDMRRWIFFSLPLLLLLHGGGAQIDSARVNARSLLRPNCELFSFGTKFSPVYLFPHRPRWQDRYVCVCLCVDMSFSPV